jgi:hypothetical protein
VLLQKLAIALCLFLRAIDKILPQFCANAPISHVGNMGECTNFSLKHTRIGFGVGDGGVNCDKVVRGRVLGDS